MDDNKLCKAKVIYSSYGLNPGDWAYGYYVPIPDEYSYGKYICYTIFSPGDEYGWHIVDPDTVCYNTELMEVQHESKINC